MLCAYDMEKKGMSAYMAVAIALLIGLLFGIVQGFLVSYLEIQPFIVSLAGMFFGRGMTSIISPDMISIKCKENKIQSRRIGPTACRMRRIPLLLKQLFRIRRAGQRS